MKNRIREIRKKRGWTIEWLAERVGTSKGHLSDIETNKREASVGMLASIAEALETSEVALMIAASKSDEDLLRLVSDYEDLSAEDRAAVSRHAQSLAAKGAG